MSNPCINRWGLNSFWHHYWYSDSRYTLNLRQDAIAVLMVERFITYGWKMDSRIMYNPYWFKSNYSYKAPRLNRFYRWTTVKNYLVNTIHTYRLRKPNNESFKMRASVLRLHEWLVVNLYWFKPDKTKNKRDRLARMRVRTQVASTWCLPVSSSVKVRTLLTIKQLSTKVVNAKYTF